MSEDRQGRHSNSEPSLDRIRREHRALAILRALEQSPGYAANDRVLTDWLEELALGGTRDVVRSTLDFLARANALRIADAGTVVVVTLTERGADLAMGRTSAEGVLKPGPQCPY